VGKLKSNNKDFNDDGFEYDNFPIKSYIEVGVVDEAEYENSKAALAAANEASNEADIEPAQAEGNDAEVSAPSNSENNVQPGSTDIKTSVTGRIPWQAKALCCVMAGLICVAVVVIVVQVLKRK
jgi:hypothetical protein